MKIEFSKHAEERIKSRKISKTRVIEVIKNPDKVILSFRFRQLLQRTYGGKILEVVIKVESKRMIVITACYLLNKDEIKIRQKN